MEDIAMTKAYRCTVVLASLAMAWGWSSMTQFVSAAGGDAAKGKSIFQSKCVSCHGTEGKGDGPSVDGMVDSEDQPIKPADLTSLQLKNGKGAKDIFRTITTGLDGAPMMSFKDIFTESERWDLVAYIYYLRGRTKGIYTDEDKIK